MARLRNSLLPLRGSKSPPSTGKGGRDDEGGAIRFTDADCREAFKGLPDQSGHSCVTSPPHFGLRDDGSFG